MNSNRINQASSKLLMVNMPGYDYIFYYDGRYDRALMPMIGKALAYPPTSYNKVDTLPDEASSNIEQLKKVFEGQVVARDFIINDDTIPGISLHRVYSTHQKR